MKHNNPSLLHILAGRTKHPTSQFLRLVRAEPNLFELCRTQQKSAMLKPAGSVCQPYPKENPPERIMNTIEDRSVVSKFSKCLRTTEKKDKERNKQIWTL
ncbi:MAG: hypothetical protein U5L96_09315 [Owenweeksia sp.]|nr:hypothetical protein [Owenweeksia sp.]